MTKDFVLYLKRNYPASYTQTNLIDYLVERTAFENQNEHTLYWFLTSASVEYLNETELKSLFLTFNGILNLGENLNTFKMNEAMISYLLCIPIDRVK